MDDLISRQAAIDAFRKELATGEQKGKYVTISSAITYLGAKQILEELPSAQPEITKCKDCKYHTHMWYCEAWNNSPGFPAVSDDMFCSLAERREE